MRCWPTCSARRRGSRSSSAAMCCPARCRARRSSDCGRSTCRCDYLRGNGDREMLDESAGRAPSRVPNRPRRQLRWCRAQLDEAQRVAIAGMARARAPRFDGIGEVLFCHATPRNDTESSRADAGGAAAADLRRRRRTWSSAATPTCSSTAGRPTRVVNAGSVGMPFEKPAPTGCCSPAAWSCAAPATISRPRRPTSAAPRTRCRAVRLGLHPAAARHAPDVHAVRARSLEGGQPWRVRPPNAPTRSARGSGSDAHSARPDGGRVPGQPVDRGRQGRRHGRDGRPGQPAGGDPQMGGGCPRRHGRAVPAEYLDAGPAPRRDPRRKRASARSSQAGAPRCRRPPAT